MKKVVVSIGGSILLTGHGDTQYLRSLADLMTTISRKKRLFVVVGGGWLARQYIGIARELGTDETYLDMIGIEATRMNAMVMISALKGLSNPMPYDDIEAALENGNDFPVVVLCGTTPLQTTDTVAALLAERVHADLFINATAVSGVFDRDPNCDPNAKRFKVLSFDAMEEIVHGTQTKAGSHAPLDPLASKVVKRARIRTLVLDGRDLDNLGKAMDGKGCVGTTIG